MLRDASFFGLPRLMGFPNSFKLTEQNGEPLGLRPAALSEFPCAFEVRGVSGVG